MTVTEALLQTQGRRAGRINQLSVRYAETLIQSDECVSAAVMANISTRDARFPGVVVLTDLRVLAVCGLPGIKRSVILMLDAVEKWEEKPSMLCCKFICHGTKNAFAFTVDPDVGEAFSRQIAIIKGEGEAFDAVNTDEISGIFNPSLVRNKKRARLAREQERASREMSRQAIRKQRAGLEQEAVSDEPAESIHAIAQRLADELEGARAKGTVESTDPKAVAARLAAELADQEDSYN